MTKINHSVKQENEGTRLFSNLWLIAVSLVFSSGLTVFHGVGLDLVQTTAKYEDETLSRCRVFKTVTGRS